MNAIEMNPIQTTAVRATGYENAPRWKGPRTNLSRYTTRRAMGIAFYLFLEASE
jgi:hypothetical protein